jgi:molybdenum cofactor cytidylyltransferase
LFSELLALKNTEGAKQIIRKHIQEVFSVPFPEGAIDIDTPKDYEQFQTLMESGEG